MITMDFHVPAHFLVVNDGPDACLLLSETGNLRLTGLAARIALAARNPIDPAALARALAPDFGALDVQSAALEMTRRGMLARGGDPADRAALVAEHIDPALLDGAFVPVVVLGEVDHRPVFEALGRWGMAPVLGLDGADESAPTLVLVDDVLNPDLAEWGHALFEASRTWLLVRPSGLTSWVGPWFSPDGDYCSECLLDRAIGLRYVEITAGGSGIQARERRYPAALHGPAAVVAAESAAIEVARILSGVPSACAGALLTWDQRTLQSQRHLVHQRPQCPQCGDPALITRAHPPVVLADRLTQSGEGGLRSSDPLLAWERMEHLISPITGITGGIRRAEGLPDDVHLYVAGPVLGSSWTSVSEIRKSFVPGGKGTTATQSRMSALGEAIERHSGIWREPREQRWHSWHEVADQAIHPNRLTGFSERQYRNRDVTNLTGKSKVHWVPWQFDEDAVISWTSAWSLTAGEPRLLPTSYCYLEYREPEVAPFCLGDTNGCAAGSTIEEAILQGLLEVIERDAAAIWWYNRIRRDGVEVPPAFVARYAELGRTIDLVDITVDNGVPVIAAVSAEAGDLTGVVIGFGAHPDPSIAADRALTEGLQCAQSLLGPIDPVQRQWLREVSLTSDPWLTPSAVREAKESGAPDRIAGAIEWVVGRLGDAGLEVIVLDQTLPDVGLPVVRVVVPGMPHFWPRFGQARLYDVPVAMGLLASATPEEDLNPTPITW